VNNVTLFVHNVLEKMISKLSVQLVLLDTTFIRQAVFLIVLQDSIKIIPLMNVPLVILNAKIVLVQQITNALVVMVLFINKAQRVCLHVTRISLKMLMMTLVIYVQIVTQNAKLVT
jgi:hypothetical protein